MKSLRVFLLVAALALLVTALASCDMLTGLIPGMSTTANTTSEVPAVTTAPTGAVYAYDVVYEGKVDGLILIDQKTGLLVKVEAFSSDFCYTVTNFKTTDVQIPSYK